MIKISVSKSSSIKTALVGSSMALVATSAVISTTSGGDGSASLKISDVVQIVSPPRTTPQIPVVPAAISVLVEFAQTHVLPPQGRSWILREKTTNLHLIGNRSALAIAHLSVTDAASPLIEAQREGVPIGSINLTPPSAFPSSERGGLTHAADAWTAELPAHWIRPGTQFVIKAANYAPSAPVTPIIGADSSLTLRILPFYLFGATEAKTQPLSVTQRPEPGYERELAAKWPVAKLDVGPHPAGFVSFDRLIMSPNAGRPAYVMTNSDQEQGGSELLGAVLGIVGALRKANGESETNTQYYASLLPLGAGGTYRWSGGGLGTVGGGIAAGTYRFSSIFFHELGHGFGLGHAGYEAESGSFPYPGGSLMGSAWGYDPGNRQFLSPFVPTTAVNFAKCAAKHQVDPSGRCYKQDPMQNGVGDQDPSYRYAMLSDYNTARIQRWFEGVTTMDQSGRPSFSGGRIFVEPNGYSRWNSITQKREALTGDNTENLGLYGINLNLPVEREVPVYAILIAHSLATPGVSYVYPPLRFTGNLIRTFDPTLAQDRADIDVKSGKYRRYCQNSGCDYTLRVTYADGFVLHRVLKDGFRSFMAAEKALPQSATNPASDVSFKSWVINVPANRAIKKIEVLETPMVWRGMPMEPKVVVQR